MNEQQVALCSFATLLGWRNVCLVDGRLYGLHPTSECELHVPDYYTDWAAASDLMFQYKVSIDFQPEQGYVAAGIVGKPKYATFYDEETDDHIRTAACRSVICAVRQHLRTLEYAARQSDAHQNEKGRP